MRRTSLAMLAPLAMLIGTPVHAQADDGQKSTELHAIIDAYWAYQLEQYPEFASSLGVDDPVGRISDAGLEAEDNRVAKAKLLLPQLEGLLALIHMSEPT